MSQLFQYNNVSKTPELDDKPLINHPKCDRIVREVKAKYPQNGLWNISFIKIDDNIQLIVPVGSGVKNSYLVSKEEYNYIEECFCNLKTPCYSQV